MSWMFVTPPNSKAVQSFHAFVTAMKRQAELRDRIDRVATQITGLEQLFTLALVSLPPNTPPVTLLTAASRRSYN